MEIKPIDMSEQLRMMRGIQEGSDIRQGQKTGPQSGQKSFHEYLSERIKEVNHLGLESERRMEGTILGTEPNPHDSVIAMQKADVAFRLLLTVKQKLEQAYQELVRTQIG